MRSSHESGSSIGSTSSSLLRRVQSHDQDAWRRLVRLYGPLVDGWIRRAGLQAADADDVFQDVFRSVAASIGQFRRDRPSDRFRGWLRIITRNKLVDFHRRLTGQPQATGGDAALQVLLSVVEELSDDSAGEAANDLTALRQRVLDLVRSEFEERTWVAFWQTTAEGRAVGDVAQELGITPSAVRLFKSRVLRRLREEMEGLEA